MKKTFDISDYQRIATLNKEPSSSIDVYIATLNGDNNPNKFYVVNAFKHSKVNHETFKNFFFFYSNQNKVKDMVNFLTSDKYFFAIFNYDNYVNIKTAFCDEKNTANYDTRCKILKDILLKLASLANMPTPAIICATKPENICLDSSNLTQIIYNFEEYPKYVKSDSRLIFDNIADIISIMLAQELKEKKFSLNPIYNRPLQLVVDKCKKNLYQNIPELIVDLEKAEKLCDVTDLKSAATAQINKRKKLIKRLTNVGLGLVITVSIFFLFKPLLANKNIPQESPTTIGNTTYNSKGNTSDNVVSIEDSIESEPEPTIDFSDIVIPPGTDIPYTEYIVQYGDTVESICKEQYNNENLVNAVYSFNNISDTIKLLAGSIIKLPSQSAIEEFVYNESSPFSSSSEFSLDDLLSDNSLSYYNTSSANTNTHVPNMIV